MQAHETGVSSHAGGVAVACLSRAHEAHGFWGIVDGAGFPMEAGKYVPFTPNECGMKTAASEFVKANVTDVALGPADARDKEQILLGATN